MMLIRETWEAQCYFSLIISHVTWNTEISPTEANSCPYYLKWENMKSTIFTKDRLIFLNAMSPKVILLPTLFLFLLSFKDLYWFGAWEQIEYFQQIYWNNQNSNLILLHHNTETRSNLKLTNQRGIWWQNCSREGCLPSPRLRNAWCQKRNTVSRKVLFP